MIEKLHVENYALIDSLSLEFNNGLNIITGETGAGKSIIIDALSLALGENIDQTFIRDNEKLVVVELLLQSEDQKLWSSLENYGIEKDDYILIKRVYNPRSKKNKYLINDVDVRKFLIKNITNQFVDLIGQHEHQSLLSVKNHIRYIDYYSGIYEDVEEYTKEFDYLNELIEKKQELSSKNAERARRVDYLKFAVTEIEESNVSQEDYEIFDKRKAIANAEKIASTLSSIYNGLTAESGIEESLGALISSFDSLIDFDSQFSQTSEKFHDAQIKLEEISEFCVSYLDDMDYSPEYVKKLDQRIDEIENLKRKYGGSIDDVLEFLEESKKELSQLESLDNELAEIDNKIKETQKILLDKALYFNKIRKEKSVELKQIIEENLNLIGMPGTKMNISINQKEDENSFAKINDNLVSINSRGIDYIEFGLSANIGEEVKPLRKIASGGELSRIMLSLKIALSKVDPVDTFLFDEIDSGIGGNAANLVGKQIKKLSENKQLICITHLPQIAVFANKHIKVKKSVENGKTVVNYKILDDEKIRKEVARMLSGHEDSPEALAHAQQLLQEAIID